MRRGREWGIYGKVYILCMDRWMAGWLVGWLGEETLLQLKLRTETEAEPEAIAMPLCSAERRQSGDCGCIYRVLWLYECCCPEFPVPSSQFPVPCCS